jgi:hypothetical protein
MTTTAIKNKILSMEAELKLLKSAVFSRPIDYEADDRTWKMIKPILKRSRAETYRKLYA